MDRLVDNRKLLFRRREDRSGIVESGKDVGIRLYNLISLHREDLCTDCWLDERLARVCVGGDVVGGPEGDAHDSGAAVEGDVCGESW